MPAANAEAMSLHLAVIGRKVAPGSHAALVLDGAGYHVAEALAVPDNVTIVRLPPYAPELNPIENVWQYLRANKLAITVFDGYDDIVDKACTAWNFFADDPHRVASITTRSWATVNL
jgi:transposase